jgi:hypothetical protein
MDEMKEILNFVHEQIEELNKRIGVNSINDGWKKVKEREKSQQITLNDL